MGSVRKDSLITFLSIALMLMSAFAIAVPPVNAQTNLLCNGDFSSDLTCWNTVKVQTSNGVRGEYPIFEVLTQIPVGTIDCTPTGREGNPFLNIEVPFGADGYVEQQVTIPSSGAGLSFVSWGNELTLGEVNAYVTIVDASGTPHSLETFIPPLMLNPGDPNNPNDDICTGSSPVSKSYDLSAYSGETVNLRLGATSQNCCGTNAFFDDVQVGVAIQSPDFELIISPESQIAALTGHTASYSISLAPLHGFNSEVFLGIAELPATFTFTFSKSQIAVGEISILKIATSTHSPPGLTPFIVTGESGTLVRSTSVSIDVRKIVGVENVVTIDQVTVKSSNFCPPLSTESCFSVQQNFAINIPGERHDWSFWAQNAIGFQRLRYGRTIALAVFQVYSIDDPSNPRDCSPHSIGPFGCRVFGGGTQVNFPLTLDLTSSIVGGSLVMTNNFGTFRFSLDQGSFINVGAFNLTGNNAEKTELDIVGPGSTIFGVGHVAFDAPTGGSVFSFARLEGESRSGSVIQQPLVSQKTCDLQPFGSPCPHTKESSENLSWVMTGANKSTFAFLLNNSDQGITYEP